MDCTVYKKFNIYQLDGRYYPQNNGVAEFNKEGYATLSGAKGAITKHLKSEEDHYKVEDSDRKELMESFFIAMAEPEMPVSEMDNVCNNILPKLFHSFNNMEAATTSAIAAIEKLAAINYVKPSRNKREGGFVGTTNKEAVRKKLHKRTAVMSLRTLPANRTQRKEQKRLDKLFFSGN